MKKLFSMVLILILLALAGSALAESCPSPDQATEMILAFQADYPDSAPWDKGEYYVWQGGIYNGGSGGMAFLFMVSDAVFGSLPARMAKPVDFESLRPGDLLRLNSNTHSVMIIEKLEDHVTVVEVMVDRRGVSRVYWGRTLNKSAVEAGDYVITRYPDGSALPSVAQGDANADGVVDGRDLLRLARYVAGQDVEVSAMGGDVNGDGIVDGRDVLRLAKKLAELI